MMARRSVQAAFAFAARHVVVQQRQLDVLGQWHGGGQAGGEVHAGASEAARALGVEPRGALGLEQQGQLSGARQLPRRAELLHGLGFEVYFPENHSALIGASRQSGNYIQRALQEGFSQFASSAMASDIGAMLAGDSPLVSVHGIDGPPPPEDALAQFPNMRRQPFSLLFEMPKGFFVSQNTYRLRHEALGESDFFLVPVEAGVVGTREIFFAVIGASANIGVVLRTGPILFVFAAIILLCLVTFRSLKATLSIVIPLSLVSILAYALMAYLAEHRTTLERIVAQPLDDDLRAGTKVILP